MSNALEYLKTKQKADGSWGTGGQGAMTGFALLCYFGRCETPDSAILRRQHHEGHSLSH